jgi:hypothetical protein
VSNKIIPYEFEQAAGSYQEPTLDAQYLNESTKAAIRNAWDTCSVLDNFGRVWVHSGSVHTLLRTTKNNANYLIGGVVDSDKYREGAELYIRGTAICQLLDFNIQNARNLQRENYIRFSELFYKAIRDCSRARELRAEFYEHLGRVTGKLKKDRVSSLGIQFDELTNHPLVFQTCEFSHIRSVSLFPELAGLIENGLIVNKETHDEITKNGINDESELYQLCTIKGWNTGWFNNYTLIN